MFPASGVSKALFTMTEDMREIGLWKDGVQFGARILGRCHVGSWLCREGWAAERFGISSGKVSLVEVDVKRLRDCNVPVQGARKDGASKETCPPGQPTPNL